MDILAYSYVQYRRNENDLWQPGIVRVVRAHSVEVSARVPIDLSSEDGCRTIRVWVDRRDIRPAPEIVDICEMQIWIVDMGQGTAEAFAYDEVMEQGWNLGPLTVDAWTRRAAVVGVQALYREQQLHERGWIIGGITLSEDIPAWMDEDDEES
jgi:hypothetical protein